jgi:transposase
MGQQYKDFLSGYRTWDQKEHAHKWLLFAQNIGSRLSIDETSLSNGELYTILTNKDAKGRKGAIVAMVEGTRAESIIKVIQKIPQKQRAKVSEITLDMAGAMNLVVRKCFPNAEQVIDRFHVQKLSFDALQEMRIAHRWEAINE